MTAREKAVFFLDLCKQGIPPTQQFEDILTDCLKAHSRAAAERERERCIAAVHEECAAAEKELFEKAIRSLPLEEES